MRKEPGAHLTFLLGESWRNAGSSRFMGLALVLLSAFAFAGVATADALGVARLAADEAAWTAAGGQVLVASNPEGLSALNCERLNGATGVKAAVGAVRLRQRAGLANAPDANLAVVGVTAGIAGFLPSRPELDSVLVTARTAEEYGLTGGNWTRLSFTSASEQAAGETDQAATDGDARQDPAPGRRIAIAELGLLGDEYASGVALPVPASGLVDACLVWAGPGAKPTLAETLADVLPGAGTKPTVIADRLISGEFARDYHAEYLTRPWRWAPIPVGAAIGLVWVLIRWVRRSEDGLYQSLGIARPQRALIRLVEWLVYSGLAAGVALLAGVIVTRMVAPDAAAAVPHVARGVSLGLAASAAAAAVAGLLPARNPLDALKDR